MMDGRRLLVDGPLAGRMADFGEFNTLRIAVPPPRETFTRPDTIQRGRMATYAAADVYDPGQELNARAGEIPRAPTISKVAFLAWIDE